jgi:hypothetical protein
MTNKLRLVLALSLTLATITVLLPQVNQPEKERAIPAPAKIVKESNKATMKEKKANERTAKLFASAGWGWRGREWTCLKSLWTSESRFDHKADNPRSTAFGIAQRLRETDRRPEIQILHGLRYIEHRYGSPCAAKSFFSKRRWYAKH